MMLRSLNLASAEQDCWPLKDRDPTTGRIVPDPSKFPDGISGVADQVHALGLKLGIYRWEEACAYMRTDLC